MASPRHNRRKGSAWEIAVRDYFLDHGLTALRLHLEGVDDQGDVEVVLGQDRAWNLTIECKNYKGKPQWDKWTAEADRESENAGTWFGVVVARTYGKTDPGTAVVRLRLDQLSCLQENNCGRVRDGYALISLESLVRILKIYKVDAEMMREVREKYGKK